MPRAPRPKWWVYVLRCADGSLYTGISTDPDRRLTQHNAGTASKYTRSRRPVALVYREQRRGKSDALRRELALKALPRRAKLALVAVLLTTTHTAGRNRTPTAQSR
ncbi:MAG: GIY-YIG nuclease family protein [Gemmataceae bacterium]